MATEAESQAWRDSLKYKGWFWLCPVFCGPAKDSSGDNVINFSYRHWVFLVPFLVMIGLENVRMVACIILFGKYNSGPMFWGVSQR